MPRIFDNLEPDSRLLPVLQDTFALASRSDFCVGYFNLRGWGGLAPYLHHWDSGASPPNRRRQGRGSRANTQSDQTGRQHYGTPVLEAPSDAQYLAGEFVEDGRDEFRARYRGRQITITGEVWKTDLFPMDELRIM